MSLVYRISARRDVRRLSLVEMCDAKTQLVYAKVKQDRTENTTHYIRRLIYCIAIPRQRKDQNIAGWSWLGRRQTAQLVTNRCLKMATDLYTVGSCRLPAD